MIDFKNENPDLIKKYYSNNIYYFLSRVKNYIVCKGFINENQVWFHSKTHTTDIFDVYVKFSIKVQLCTVSNFPELLISYDKKSRVLKTPVSELVKTVSQSLFKKVLYKNRVLKFDDFLKQKMPEFELAFPVVNTPLINKLGLEEEIVPKSNRFREYLEKINTIYTHVLFMPDFMEVIPLNDKGFFQVPEELISGIKDESNDLEFCDEKIGRTPKTDFRNLKPFDNKLKHSIHLFYIYHIDDIVTKKKLQGYLENGHRFYRGLQNYAGILFHTDEASSIQFSNLLDPIPEINTGLEKLDFSNAKIRYLAIYLTPYNKSESSKQEIRVYARVKEMLLQRNIASQFVEPANVNEEKGNEFVYSLTNMSVAILAKLGGIPWRLHTVPKNELIIGIGVFKHESDQVEYISSAISFDNTGRFKQFGYFMRNEIDMLAGLIVSKVREFTANFNNPERIIIHFYKRLSDDELKPIEDALMELNLPNPIPIFIVTINKTEAKDIFVFDAAWQHLMPISGTNISIGNKKYVLFNNARYGNVYNSQEGFPFPVKLAIDCTNPLLLENKETINEHLILIKDNVTFFSRNQIKKILRPLSVNYPGWNTSIFMALPLPPMI